MKNKKSTKALSDSEKKERRLKLAKIIKKESLLTREESMNVLKEFEAIEFDNY